MPGRIAPAACLAGLLAVVGLPASAAPHAAGHAPAATSPVDRANPTRGPEFDEKSALATSQSAIGRTLGDITLRDRNGRGVRLADYRGKPLVISLIYTSCYHICPTTTQHLAKVVGEARHALGDDSFRVVTIGFDTLHDTPDAMRMFAAQQGVDISGWEFLSADQASMRRLADNIGFLYFPSGAGFNHLVQATLVDRDGKIVRQVYGMKFDMPLLVDPLKQLVLGGHPGESAVAGLWSKVKLFCTTYDPANDRYRFDYSLFIGMLIGFLIITSGVVFLVREMRRRRIA